MGASRWRPMTLVNNCILTYMLMLRLATNCLYFGCFYCMDSCNIYSFDTEALMFVHMRYIRLFKTGPGGMER